MFDMIKQWKWYDWAMFLIRLVTCISLIFTFIEFRDQFSIVLWIIILWELAAFSIPWLCLLINHKAYWVTESILSGGIAVYLTSVIPEAYLVFIVPTFLMAANSVKLSYRWTGPVAIVLIPLLIKLYSPVSNLLLIMIHIALAFAVGFAFHLLIVNHRQNGIIRQQNMILEQYLSQVERITLLEERERLSRELHDTMGHTYTSIIMGMETLRSSIVDSESRHKLDNLLELTRTSFDEIRGYLHQMDSPQEKLPLKQSLRQLTGDFEQHAGVVVRFRVYGEEYQVPGQVKMTLYRCLQESLTNSVRHGQATIIEVSLQFEPQQTRLEVKDNGSGSAMIQEGFGLTAMKERAFSLQGQISIYSEPGDGTAVTCSLPRHTELQGEVIKLLLVDNEPFIRESLKVILESEKDLSVVGSAASGEEALELCGKFEPDLVLMDLDMPEMDGVAAMRIIKEQRPHIRVVILTNFQQKEKAVEAMRSGADGYLLKVMEPRELAETIRMVHRGGTLIDPLISAKLFGGGDIPVLSLEETGYRAPANMENPINPSGNGLYGLSPRELTILQCLSKGMRYKSIAMKLYLSDGTVRNYASTLYAKLGVRNREEAVKKAKEAGLM
ncbi:MAG: response regulator [Bacillota bacterium]